MDLMAGLGSIRVEVPLEHVILFFGSLFLFLGLLAAERSGGGPPGTQQEIGEGDPGVNPPGLRPISGLRHMGQLIARSLERGHHLHLSLGRGGLGGLATAETLAALQFLAAAIRLPGMIEVRPYVTTADATTLPVAEDVLADAYGELAAPPELAQDQVYWVAPDPAAYGATALMAIGPVRLEASLIAGRLGDEVAWLLEEGQRRNLSHLVATADPAAAALSLPAAADTLIGEELFAAPAYLSQADPVYRISLETQDQLRLILILIILAGVIVSTLGPL